MSTAATPESAHPPLPAPPSCPFCGSEVVMTSGQIVADISYWRCGECREVWNPLRHHPIKRH
jgi:transposase-like protein